MILWCSFVILNLKCFHSYALSLNGKEHHFQVNCHFKSVNVIFCVSELLRLVFRLWYVREMEKWLCKCVNNLPPIHLSARPGKRSRENVAVNDLMVGFFSSFFKRVERNNRNSCVCLAAAQRRKNPPYEINGPISFSPAKKARREHIGATSPRPFVWWGKRPAPYFWKVSVSSINRDLFFDFNSSHGQLDFFSWDL